MACLGANAQNTPVCPQTRQLFELHSDHSCFWFFGGRGREDTNRQFAVSNYFSYLKMTLSIFVRINSVAIIDDHWLGTIFLVWKKRKPIGITCHRTHTKYASRYACSIVVHANDTDVAVACVHFFWRASSWRTEQTFLEAPDLHYPSIRAGGWSPLVQRGADYVTVCTLSVRVWHNEFFFRRRESFFLKYRGVSNFCFKNGVCDGADQGCRKEAFSRHV